MSAKDKRAIASLACNAAAAMATFAWLYLGDEGAGNLLKIYAGFAVFSSLVVFSEEAQKRLQAKGRSLPQWFTNSVDMGIALALGYTGHIAMSVLFIWGAIAENIAFADPKEDESK